MATVTLEEAQRRLGELVGELASGNEFVIVAEGKPVATLSPPPVRPSIRDRISIRDIQPVSAGAPLRPYPDPDDDILGEMLEERMDREFPRREP